MDNKKRLAYAIIRFLHDQLRHGGLLSDAQESLEVAIQCLETAFGVTLEDSNLALTQTLPEIFEAAAGKEMPQNLRSPEVTPPSEEDSAEAERLKTEGNEQMKVENFEAAVHFYGKKKTKLDLHEMDFYAFYFFLSPSPPFLYSLMAPRPFSKQSQQAVNADQHQSPKNPVTKVFSRIF
uniref:Small glutamine rich tetratricopeptide repeat containing alpha n=1 Tax=Myotis myotis TaxID=51298 RepID=A0A7J7XKA4_MYOMY|nr:small glutamine rich tetratricopeptide repeat containing alpha [Myotis myotis]